MTAASVYSSQSSEPGSPEQRSHEPSMEDILASIRRIIADDQSQAPRTGAASGRRNGQNGQAAAPEGNRNGAGGRTGYEDMLDLARLAPLAVPDRGEAERTSQPSVDPDPVDQQPTGDAFDEERAQAAAAPSDHDAPSSLRARMPEPAGHVAANDQYDSTDLVPYEAEMAEEEALISEPLGASVMSAFETLAATVVLQNTPMLEGLMRDLLRPMLKTWLDDNLPALVERLVRSEIERVARGPRG